jgi:hypothetical protein
MNKTLYLRDDEAPIWDRARELSGDKLSPVVVNALKRFVAEKEAQAKGYERIVVEYNDALDHRLPKVKAFYGRWIINREKPYELRDEDGREGDFYSVAETAKGNLVVYKHTESEEASWGHKLLIYGSFQEAAADREVNPAIREAVKRRGVPVEELDI